MWSQLLYVYFPIQGARAVRRGRGRLDRAARSEPVGVQLAAGGDRVRAGGRRPAVGTRRSRCARPRSRHTVDVSERRPATALADVARVRHIVDTYLGVLRDEAGLRTASTCYATTPTPTRRWSPT